MLKIAEPGSQPGVPVLPGLAGLSVHLAIQHGILLPPRIVPKDPGAMTEKELLHEIERSKATLVAFKTMPPAGEVERLALLQNELARRDAPKMIPLAQLGDPRDLARAIISEREYLNSPKGKNAPAAVRQEHERYLTSLVGEAQHRIDVYEADPEVQKRRLYAQLAKFGDTSGCRAGDTVDSLRARVAELALAKGIKWDEAEAMRLSVGLDYKTGTAEGVAAYTLGEALKAINPGSGTGILFAAAAAMRGGSV